MAGLTFFETDSPEMGQERRRTDRRGGHDRRTVDLLRETGRPEHDRRRGADRRSGRDRRQGVPGPDRATEVVLPTEIFMPWQMG